MTANFSMQNLVRQPAVFAKTARAVAVGWWGTFCIGLMLSSSLSAQERGNVGLVVPIPTTLTTEATSRLRSALYGPLRRYEDECSRDPKGIGYFYLICDFNPDNRDNASEEPGACQTLARYLRDLQKKQGIQVLAFVHGNVTRHAVLPVLACSEILLSQQPPAHLGKVADAQHPLERLDRLAYEDLANKRYPAVLVRKMYDASVEVLKGRDGLYHDANEKPLPPANRSRVSVPGRQPCIRSSKPASSVSASRCRATTSTRYWRAIGCRGPVCIRRWTTSVLGISTSKGRSMVR